ncbi:MAG: hypothetical protein ACK5OB_00340 [Pirellula sp.]
MEPFRLVCPQCSSKVVVRNAQMIGQTLPCPKCRGPIRVEAPAQPPPPLEAKPTESPKEAATPLRSNIRPSTINSGAITKFDPADWDLGNLESSLGEPTATAPGVASELPDFSEVDALPIPSLSDPAPSATATNVATNTAPHASGRDATTTANSPVNAPSVGGAPPIPGAVPGVTPGKLRQQQAQSRRQLILLGTVGMTGCLLAVLAFLAFLQSFGKGSSKSPIAQKNPIEAEGNAGKSEDGKAFEANVPGGQPGINQDAAVQPSEKVEGATENTAGDMAETPTSPLPQPNALANDQNKAAPNGAAPNGEAPSAPANPATDGGLFPGGFTLGPDGNQVGAGPTTDADSKAPVDEGLPSVFREFEQMFNRSSQNNWDDVGRGNRSIDSELSMENAEVLLKDEIFPDPIAVPRWEERSERTLTSVKTRPMNLVQAVHWLNKTGGMGISLDWFHLNLIGFDWERTVSVEGENRTLGSILEQLANAYGLEAASYSEGFLYLKPKAEGLRSRLRIDGSTPSGPISSGLPDGQASAIVELVANLWEVNGCRVENDQMVWSPETEAFAQAQVLSTLQSIREVRAGQSVKPGASSDPFDFARPVAWAACSDRVQRPIAADVVAFEERPAIEILVRAAEATGTRLLIDWPATWAHGMHPGRLSVSVLRHRTLEQIAQRYLVDYSLELVPMDGQSILLTTDVERRSTMRVIALRTDRGLSLQDLKQALRQLVPRGPDLRSRFQCVTLPGDENLVLVRICPPTLEQMRDPDLKRALGIDRNGE